jgi:hypothetical protein
MKEKKNKTKERIKGSGRKGDKNFGSRKREGN